MKRETAFKLESAAGSSFVEEAQKVGGVLELAYYRAAEDGQALSTNELMCQSNWMVLKMIIAFCTVYCIHPMISKLFKGSIVSRRDTTIVINQLTMILPRALRILPSLHPP